MKLLKTLLLFLLLSCVAHAETQTVIASYYYDTDEDFAILVRRVDYLVHHGWKLIEVKTINRTLYFVLQSPDPVKAP